MVDRQVDPGASPVGAKKEQVILVIELVERNFTTHFDRETAKVGAGPVEPSDCLVALRLRALLEAADYLAIATLLDGIEGLALAAVGQRDELDRPARERPADVAANLVAWGFRGQIQAVVAAVLAGRIDEIDLVEIFGEAIKAGVEVDRLVGRLLE